MRSRLLMDPAPTRIYTLSLHDALPILRRERRVSRRDYAAPGPRSRPPHPLRIDVRRRGVEAVLARFADEDRKSTRLNSSHSQISYAVFCLKKKIREPENVERDTIIELY